MRACLLVQLRTIPGSSEEVEHLGLFVSGFCCLFSEPFKAFRWGHGRGRPEGAFLQAPAPAEPLAWVGGWAGAGRGRPQRLSTPDPAGWAETAFVCDVWEVLRRTTKPLRRRGAALSVPLTKTGQAGGSSVGDQPSLWLAFFCYFALWGREFPAYICSSRPCESLASLVCPSVSTWVAQEAREPE